MLGQLQLIILQMLIIFQEAKGYRHPDIPEEPVKVAEDSKASKKKKKKSKKHPVSNANGKEDFDLNWDDE